MLFFPSSLQTPQCVLVSVQLDSFKLSRLNACSMRLIRRKENKNAIQKCEQKNDIKIVSCCSGSNLLTSHSSVPLAYQRESFRSTRSCFSCRQVDTALVHTCTTTRGSMESHCIGNDLMTAQLAHWLHTSRPHCMPRHTDSLIVLHFTVRTLPDGSIAGRTC